MTLTESLAFLASVFGPFGTDDALREEAVRAAEARLKIAFPRALRALYLVTGASKRLHHAHNELVALDRVDFGGDHLVFYEENQSVVVWGVARAALREEDPSVEQGQFDATHNAWTFYPEFASVSEFAAAQGAWQAVQGGLPYVGVKEPDIDAASETRAALSTRLGQASLETSSIRAWLVDGGVALDALGELIGLATRTAAQFEEASSRIGMPLESWDYATLRDG